MSNLPRLVILDRDGVINEDSDDYIKSPDEWQPIPGSLAAIARLHRANWRVVVATNQSGVGRGYFSEADARRVQERLRPGARRRPDASPPPARVEISVQSDGTLLLAN